MRVIILKDKKEIGKWSVYQIAKKILKFNPTPEKPFVLGLPTGSTPIETYKELINLYKEGVLSFENVITFNMDEYVGLAPEHEQSYHYFMHENFFKHIDIKKENINILRQLFQQLSRHRQPVHAGTRAFLICSSTSFALTGMGRRLARSGNGRSYRRR